MYRITTALDAYENRHLPTLQRGTRVPVGEAAQPMESRAREGLRRCGVSAELLPEAPWPIVHECHFPAPSLVKQGHTWAQCDGSHEHEWVAWHAAPAVDQWSPNIRVVGKSSGPGLPVRCRVCGGRKCDTAPCLLRRHHGGPHEHY